MKVTGNKEKGKKDVGEHMYTTLTPLTKKQFELFDF